MEEYEGTEAAFFESGEEEREKEERAGRLTPLAKEVVMVLVKTIKATKLYLPNNPIYQRFRDELQEKFEKYFQDEELLSFMVQRFELLFLDQQVYHNPDKEDNIALMFFKDGIREFCFHRGISPEEIDGFIDILKFDIKERELDDDLVTLLWEKDFKSITYTVTDEATEEEAFEEESLLSFGEEPEALRQLDELRGRTSDEPRAGTAPVERADAAVGAPVLEHENLYVTDSAEDDYLAIRGSYKPPDDVALLNDLTDIFYEILITEKQQENFDLLVESLSKAVEIFVSRGDLALATILVMKVQELSGSGEIPGDWVPRLDLVVNKAASEKLIGRVGEFMAQGGQEALEAAGSYLSQLDSRAIPSTVKLLESIDNRRSRKAVCDIINAQCGGNGKLLLPFLTGKPWYVLRNVLTVLGKVADPETAAAVGATLQHEEPRVRREAISTLLAIKGERAEGYISEGLNDEDRSIRLLSARVLAELSPDKAYKQLMALTADAKFNDREFDEKREIYEIIGRTGKERAFPFFAQQFSKKSFLRMKRSEKLRACAAYGLAACGTEEAYQALQSEIDSKSKLVRKACLDGLKRMKR
ncbi:MAG: HEAT repeat domain-containing protein [Nitrospirota bacterium]